MVFNTEKNYMLKVCFQIMSSQIVRIQSLRFVEALEDILSFEVNFNNSCKYPVFFNCCLLSKVVGKFCLNFRNRL